MDKIYSCIGVNFTPIKRVKDMGVKFTPQME